MQLWTALTRGFSTLTALSMATLVLVGCDESSVVNSPVNIQYEEPNLYASNGVVVYEVIGRDDLKVIRYVGVQDVNGKVMTFQEASQVLEDDDLVTAIFIQKLVQAGAITELDDYLETSPSTRDFRNKMETKGGEPLPEVCNWNCLTGTPPNCQGSWGCIKSCSGG